MRIVNTIAIARPAEQVFAFVTTPANWPRWHPSSLGVSAGADHPLEEGEQVTEEYRVAGQTGSAVWTVREREAPRRWVIDGVARNGNAATITYTLTPKDGGTHFERELILSLPQTAGFTVEAAALQARIEEESAEALRRLKAVLDG
jgi:uncharacterized protein YndB with AHSA1/START domain